MRKIPFPCTSCGACCRSVTGKMPTKADGRTCIHLEGKSCKIYADRPDICRVDLMIDKANDPEFSYKTNVKACNFLQQVHGIDESYRVAMEG